MTLNVEVFSDTSPRASLGVFAYEGQPFAGERATGGYVFVPPAPAVVPLQEEDGGEPQVANLRDFLGRPMKRKPGRPKKVVVEARASAMPRELADLLDGTFANFGPPGDGHADDDALAEGQAESDVRTLGSMPEGAWANSLENDGQVSFMREAVQRCLPSLSKTQRRSWLTAVRTVVPKDVFDDAIVFAEIDRIIAQGGRYEPGVKRAVIQAQRLEGLRLAKLETDRQAAYRSLQKEPRIWSCSEPGKHAGKEVAPCAVVEIDLATNPEGPEKWAIAGQRIIRLGGKQYVAFVLGRNIFGHAARELGFGVRLLASDHKFNGTEADRRAFCAAISTWLPPELHRVLQAERVQQIDARPLAQGEANRTHNIEATVSAWGGGMLVAREGNATANWNAADIDNLFRYDALVRGHLFEKKALHREIMRRAREPAAKGTLTGIVDVVENPNLQRSWAQVEREVAQQIERSAQGARSVAVSPGELIEPSLAESATAGIKSLFSRKATVTT